MKMGLLAELIFVMAIFSGCGWVQTLRRDVDDDPPSRAHMMEYGAYREGAYRDGAYREPAARYVPPAPTTVRDERLAEIAGSPVDLSGVRAKNMRIKADNFFAESEKNENSLWSEDGQANYLFATNKLKAPGDLVTIVIEEQLRKEMVDSVKRLLPPEYRDQEIRVPGLTKDADAGRSVATASAVAKNIEGAATAAVAEEEFSYSDSMTGEVLERYPNGNVRVRGIKRVPFKRQVRNIEVVAIVKGADISEKDVVKSSKFFEQQVELYR